MIQREMQGVDVVSRDFPNDFHECEEKFKSFSWFMRQSLKWDGNFSSFSCQ